jgi:hypothetical protein
LRFSTRTCPRVPPTTAASFRTDPRGSGGYPARSGPIRRPDSPSEEDARAHSEECSRWLAPLAAREVSSPRGLSHSPLCQREPSAGRPFRCPASGISPSPTWWTSSRTGNRFTTSGHSESAWLNTASQPHSDPRGVVLSCGVHHRVRRRIFGSRHPPRRFDDHAVFRKRWSRHRSTDASHGLGSPPGHTGQSPPKSPDDGGPPEVFRPYSDVSAEVHNPGFPHPVRSAFRVSHPLDGFLPPAPSGLEDRSHSWGSPYRAFPPRGAVRLSAPLPSCCF